MLTVFVFFAVVAATNPAANNTMPVAVAVAVAAVADAAVEDDDLVLTRRPLDVF